MILLQPLYSVYEWYISKNLEKDKMPNNYMLTLDEIKSRVEAEFEKNNIKLG